MTSLAVAAGAGSGMASAKQFAVEEQSQVKGLENAQLRVQNEEQKQHLEQVMEKIQTQHRERLNKLEGLVIEETDDAFEAMGKVDAKFLGFLPYKKQVKYQLDNEGQLMYIKSPWDGLFKFNENPVLS